MAPASIKRIASTLETVSVLDNVAYVLAGCAQKSLTETANIEPETPVVKTKTIDYRWAECKTLAAFIMKGSIIRYFGYVPLSAHSVLCLQKHNVKPVVLSLPDGMAPFIKVFY